MSAVAAPTPPRPRLIAVGGGVSGRVRVRRALLGALLTAVLAFLGLLGLRSSSVFTVEAVRVRGVAGAPSRAVADEARKLVAGRSLLAVDAGQVQRGLEALPFVSSARVDRAFPQTLAVRVTVEQPAALVVSGADTLTVARSGRVMARSSARVRRRDLPLLAAATVPERPGETIGDPALRAELAVANAVPPAFGLRLASVQARPDGLVAETRRGLRIELGDATDLDSKLLAARAVAAAAVADNPRLIDVTVPSAPAVLGAVPNSATLGAASAGDGSGAEGRVATDADPRAVVADLFVTASTSR